MANNFLSKNLKIELISLRIFTVIKGRVEYFRSNYRRKNPIQNTSISAHVGRDEIRGGKYYYNGNEIPSGV